MSSKRKKSRRDDQDEYDVPKKSLVDYSKVASRPEANPRRSGPENSASAQAPAAAAAAPMSSQMEAVVRLMSGREERTIAEKLADSNRPTWEQYKKDNEDKLNLEGMDQKKMEEYRRELDAEREKRLQRGRNRGAKKKKKRKNDDDDDDDSSDSSSDRRHRKRKKHKKKKERKKHKRKRGESDSDDDTSSNEDEKKHKKKKSKKAKKSKKDEDSDGEHYRLSTFFAGSDEDE